MKNKGVFIFLFLGVFFLSVLAGLTTNSRLLIPCVAMACGCFASSVVLLIANKRYK